MKSIIMLLTVDSRLYVAALVLTALTLVATGCRDKAAEKRIAELEARLSQLEKDKPAQTAAATSTTPANPVAAETKPEGHLPSFKFERMEYDFGQIREGDKVVYSYKFQNTGEAPLIIQSVQPTCGCTAPDWSKEPLPVGGSGFVKVEFDSNGKQIGRASCRERV